MVLDPVYHSIYPCTILGQAYPGELRRYPARTEPRPPGITQNRLHAGMVLDPVYHSIYPCTILGCTIMGHARSWDRRIPASYGAIRLGQSLALPELRKAV
jgi:hypothetical protein